MTLPKNMNDTLAIDMTQLHNQDDDIDLLEMFFVLWKQKKKIVLTSLSFLIISVAIALWLPNVYRARVVMAPSSEQQGGGLGALAGQLGGLASLAGVSLSAGSTDQTTIAMSLAESRQFITAFIHRHKLEVPLLAVTRWDKKTNKLIVDDDLYDEKTKQWVRDDDESVEPTDWELFDEFSNHYSISKDMKSGIITFTLDYYSPELVKQWADWFVFDLNQAVKEKDVREAKQNIEYLNKQLSQTSVADMQTVFYKMIEEQTKTLMLAEVNQEYAFKTLDPAVVPDLKEKVKPKRAIICIVGGFLGGLLAIFWILITYAIRKRNQN